MSTKPQEGMALSCPQGNWPFNRALLSIGLLVPLLLWCLSCHVEITCKKGWHEEAWGENQMAKSCTWSRSHIDFYTPSHHPKWLKKCEITKIKHCHLLAPKSWLSRRPLHTALGRPPWDKALPPAQPRKALSSASETAKHSFCCPWIML